MVYKMNYTCYCGYETRYSLVLLLHCQATHKMTEGEFYELYASEGPLVISKTWMEE